MSNYFLLFIFRSIVRYGKTVSSALTPERITYGSAGFCLFTYETLIIPAKKICKIDTGIQIIMPPGFYAKVTDLNARVHLYTILGGTIDPDYSSSIVVVVHSHTTKRIKMQKGSAIAQLIFIPYLHCILDNITLNQTRIPQQTSTSYNMNSNNNNALMPTIEEESDVSIWQILFYILNVICLPVPILYILYRLDL